MSYGIQLYRAETKEKEQSSKDKDFFDNEDNVVAFTREQTQGLKERLLQYRYELTHKDEYGLHFSHSNDDFGSALLGSAALYFRVSWNTNSIFEVGMVASEFTDSEVFEKYDPQNSGWEEI